MKLIAITIAIEVTIFYVAKRPPKLCCYSLFIEKTYLLVSFSTQCETRL